MRYAIIAAGEGSRLAEEGLDVPKPLVPIGGVPMIERLAGILMRQDADRIAVIINEQSPDTRALLESMSLRMPIDFVVRDTPSPMHSLLALAPFLACDRFCAMTVDTVFQEKRFSEMVSEFKQTGFDGIMGVTSFVDDEKPLYVGVDESMVIKGFHDLAEGCRFVSAGVYCLKPAALDVLSECVESGGRRMRLFQRSLIEEGMRLKAFDLGRVIDVDHLSDVQKAGQIALEG
ncbi:MAG: NTP transferase domain-containing protein [Bacteroidaceae bacterium]|nr:NTP transferase domain-containing protein [Bacteroidaceae bacterium]